MGKRGYSTFWLGWSLSNNHLIYIYKLEIYWRIETSGPVKFEKLEFRYQRILWISIQGRKENVRIN